MNNFSQATMRASSAIDELSNSFSEPVSREFDALLEQAFGEREIEVEIRMGAACILVDGEPDWWYLFHDESGHWRTEDSQDTYYEVEDAIDEMNQLVNYGEPFYIEYVGKYAAS